ncbi:PoNe immunity protein domain-containing protein [Clostridium sp. DL1XJH146]
MCRDKLRDQIYFDKFLAYENARIIKFSTTLEKLVTNKGENDIGVINGYKMMANFCKNKMVALYSAGNSIDEVKNAYGDVLKYSEKNKEISYNEIIDIVAIAILLNVKNEIRNNVIKIIKKCNNQDALLLALTEYLIYGKIEKYQDELLYPSQYKQLLSILKEEDREIEKTLLLNYINNIWYESNKDAAWYDSHKSNNETYCGYWCFIGAAIVKILNLDNKNFKSLNYYPYDMVC